MSRTALLSVPATLVLLLAAPGASLAAQPVREHVIVSDHADAAFSSLEGCILTEVFVSSMDGMFSGSPGGPVNKQGLTGVLIIQSDTCQEPEGKGYPRVFEGLAQTLAPLSASSAPAQAASFQGVIPVHDDISGLTYDVTLDLTWQATSAAAHETTRTHVREPHGGIIRSTANNWMADAVAFGSVMLNGVNLTPDPTFDAHLSRVKQNCSVIQHPRGGADFDCS